MNRIPLVLIVFSAGVAVATLIGSPQPSDVCAHPDGRGLLRPVDVSRIERAIESLRIEAATPEIRPLRLPAARLPACRSRTRRELRRVDIPEAWHGLVMHFVTRRSASSRRGIVFVPEPNDPRMPPQDLVEWLGVRCVNTRVTFAPGAIRIEEEP